MLAEFRLQMADSVLHVGIYGSDQRSAFLFIKNTKLSRFVFRK